MISRLNWAGLRLRLEGGPGGHNGLESIIVHFGTEAIPRLRIGIGAAPSEGAVDYVLGRFFEEERPVVEKMIERAAEAVKCAIDKGAAFRDEPFQQNPSENHEEPLRSVARPRYAGQG